MDKLKSFSKILEISGAFRETFAAEFLCVEMFPDSAYDNNIKHECVGKLAEKIALKNKEKCAVTLLDTLKNSYTYTK